MRWSLSSLFTVINTCFLDEVTVKEDARWFVSPEHEYQTESIKELIRHGSRLDNTHREYDFDSTSDTDWIGTYILQYPQGKRLA